MTSNTDNIILFKPKSQINSVMPIQELKKETMETIDEKIDDLRMYHTHEFLEYYIPKIFEDLAIAGFNFDKFYNEKGESSPHIHKLESFLAETLRSTILAYHGIPHPLQKLADGLFVYDEKENSCQLLDAIYIDFTVSNKKPAVKKSKKKPSIEKPETENLN